MDVKEYLNQIRVLQVKIKQRRAQAAELRDQTQSLLSHRLKSDRVQTSNPASPMEERVVKYLDIEREIAELIDQLTGARNRIISDIHCLDDERYIKVLYKRYVEGKKFTTISRELNYSHVHTERLCRQAEQAFSKKMMMNDTFDIC